MPGHLWCVFTPLPPLLSSLRTHANTRPPTVAILVIIAIVVAVYVVINNRNNGNGKRSLIEVRGIAWGGGEKPVTQVYAQSKIVVPGQDYDGSSDAPLAKFAGGAVPVRGLPQRRYVEWSPDDLLGDD